MSSDDIWILDVYKLSLSTQYHYRNEHSEITAHTLRTDTDIYQASTLKTFCVPELIHLKITASVSEALPTTPHVLTMSL
jgi:hypothetical protein